MQCVPQGLRGLEVVLLKQNKKKRPCLYCPEQGTWSHGAGCTVIIRCASRARRTTGRQGNAVSKCSTEAMTTRLDAGGEDLLMQGCICLIDGEWDIGISTAVFTVPVIFRVIKQRVSTAEMEECSG